MPSRELPFIRDGDSCPPGRHKHPYQIPATLPPCWQCKRRDVTITHGGPLPVSVDCPRDHIQVKRATDYERGWESARAAGHVGRGGF